MSVKVANSRFISLSLQRFGALYQHLFSGVSDFQKLADKLVQEAYRAKAYRDTEKLEEVGLILSNLPILEYQLIGQYYRGWAGYLKGEVAPDIFEKVAEQSKTYKAMALVSMAAIDARKGDFESEYKWFVEALKYSNSPTTTVEALRAMAVVKAKEGFNKQSLRDLENMWPLVRYGDLRVYHDYLNSLAVEYGEIGRIEEASNICKVVLASPYINAYPEWRETSKDIALRGYKSRSSVPVIQSFSEPKNVVKLPIPERTSAPVSSESKQPAKLFNYSEWKKKMGKNGEDKIDTQKMSEREVLLKIIELSSGDDVTEWELRQILDAIIKIRYKRD